VRGWTWKDRCLRPWYPRNRADGKLGFESAVHGISQQLPRMRKDQVNRGNFNLVPTKRQEETVFFRHAIKTPRVVRLILGEIANLFHPMSAPWTGVEIGNHPKGPANNLLQADAQIFPRQSSWDRRNRSRPLEIGSKAGVVSLSGLPLANLRKSLFIFKRSALASINC
jgi:hypothetical protein